MPSHTTVEINTPTRASRPSGKAIMRGARGKCPACGEGRLFDGYTAVKSACDKCGEELHHQRADDFPPYVVIMVLGHIIVPLMLLIEQAYAPALWVHAALWFPSTIIGALLMLPVAKGAIIGWQWSSYMHGFDPDHVDELEAMHGASTDTMAAK